jgi:hypothetical protein
MFCGSDDTNIHVWDAMKGSHESNLFNERYTWFSY